MDDRLRKEAFKIAEKAQKLDTAMERIAFLSSEEFANPEAVAMAKHLLFLQTANSAQPALPRLAPGARFAHYEILARLGKHDSGRTYSARESGANRLIALRLLSAAEAAAWTGSGPPIHPNIVAVHELVRDTIPGKDAATAALAMELVEGTSLADQRTSGSPRPVSQVASWGHQIASALAVAHGKGLVHGGLRPDTILIRTLDGRLKILHFSLPQSANNAYISPEQVEAPGASPASDVFSLGILLYELATGIHPFQAPSPLQRLVAVLEHNPPPASSIAANIPAELDRLLAAMLAKSAAARPSATAVADALISISPTHQTAVARPRPRWRIFAAAAAIVLAAGFLGRSNFDSKPVLVNSVVVLPFKSADESMNHLTAGLHYEISLGLAQTPGLRVASSTGSRKYSGPNPDLKRAGADFNVDAVLVGSAGRVANNVVLQLNMLDARHGTELWSGKFEQPITSLSAFPPEVTGRIGAKLGARVVAPLRKDLFLNPDSYEAYLRARYHYSKRTREDMALAEKYCEEALRRSPRFAEAWSLLAASQGFTPGMYNSLSPQDLFAKTRQAINKAIEINPDLPEVHMILGAVKFFQERDWAGAEKEFRKTIELNPNDGQAHLFLAILMRVEGRKDEEQRYVRTARDLDPLSSLVASHVAWTEYFRGSDVTAEEELQKALALDPTHSSHKTLLGYIRLHQRRFPEAIAAFQKATELSAGLANLGDLGYAYAITGDRTNAELVLKKLQSDTSRYVPAGAVGWIYMGLGDKDRAFEWFAKASDENYQWLKYMNVWPVFDRLRGDSRMKDLQQKFRLIQN